MPDLRALRRQLGLTQAQLAAELGVSTKQVNERENGKCPVKRETLLAMEALLLRRHMIPSIRWSSTEDPLPPRETWLKLAE